MAKKMRGHVIAGVAICSENQVSYTITAIIWFTTHKVIVWRYKIWTISFFVLVLIYFVYFVVMIIIIVILITSIISAFVYTNTNQPLYRHKLQKEYTWFFSITPVRSEIDASDRVFKARNLAATTWKFSPFIN